MRIPKERSSPPISTLLLFLPKKSLTPETREDHAANSALNQEEGFPFPFLRINPQDRCHLRDFHPSYFTTSPGEMVSPYSGQKKHPIPISKYRCIVYHPSGNGRWIPRHGSCPWRRQGKILWFLPSGELGPEVVFGNILEYHSEQKSVGFAVKDIHRIKTANRILLWLFQCLDIDNILRLRSQFGFAVKENRRHTNKRFPQCRRYMAFGHTNNCWRADFVCAKRQVSSQCEHSKKPGLPLSAPLYHLPSPEQMSTIPSRTPLMARKLTILNYKVHGLRR